ncbi:MAG TPA: hypothetical protein VJ183_20115 [Chloroflexia bacterium]|nr:hypothetical protein [Chloroflexia bacterium]
MFNMNKQVLSDEQQAERDRRAYELAKEYLLGLDGVTPEVVEGYLSHTVEERPDTLGGVYKRLISSAQNAQMMPSVIGGSIGGIDKLEDILFGFSPAAVSARYPNDIQGALLLLDTIKGKLHPTGQVRSAPGSLWVRFCRAVISGAVFLAKFEHAGEFYEWVERFDADESKRSTLPMEIAREVHGIGFGLACDFIKELGFYNFSKPDVHIKAIFAELGLSGSTNDYDVFAAVSRVAQNNGKSAYDVDKLFWLVASGNFYIQGRKTGRNRVDFISSAQQELGI